MKGKHPSYKIIENEIPDDAKIIDCRLNQFEGNVMEIIIESETFPKIELGEIIPEIIPIFEIDED